MKKLLSLTLCLSLSSCSNLNLDNINLKELIKITRSSKTTQTDNAQIEENKTKIEVDPAQVLDKLNKDTPKDNIIEEQETLYKILFINPNNYDSNIFSINSDASNQTRVTKEKGNYSDISLSKDNQKLAYYNDEGISILNLETKEVIKIKKNGNNSSFSPDSSKIVFEKNDDIYISNIDGTDEIKLTDDSFTESNPIWSPDGKKIIYQAQVNYMSYSEIFIMNIDGTEQTRLTNNDYYDGKASFSSDGSQIIFVSENPENSKENYVDNEIFTMDIKGKNIKRITNNDFNDDTPKFSSDGKKIVFYSHRFDSDELDNIGVFIMDSDGKNQKFIIEGKNPVFVN